MESKLTCRFCGLVAAANDENAFQLDRLARGFWCEECDGFSYLPNVALQHRFTVIFEDPQADKPFVEKPPLPLLKRLSVLRYPGGKSKVIDYLYSHLQLARTKTLVSPYTGGGSFELAMLHAGAIEHLHLNDLDTGVFALWYLMKHYPDELIQRLEIFRPTHQDFFQAQALIKDHYHGADLVDAAWAALIVNRLAYSGIAKANPLGGRHGSHAQLLQRWNPADLIRRIKRIHAMSDRITITNEDAYELIEEAYWDQQSTIFIDPPYFRKGKDLYPCYYEKDEHLNLQ
ncbi:DNA adenine methylase [Alkalihalobacillus oceani]|uniref:site-specific DNA-methyltransferase (adenine-specific) n=1 Tax=Halalkalibacter oceani TaxID=1653776 RepID=A0A9X2DTX6_9BACI|nr:DNA adenine methylase [Halalkalibacter oceani]MCM3716596.1 DNA adenine methylase [Halalkalibacter oceani]